MDTSSQPREPRDLMRRLTAGELSRRDFVKRAAALGFSASAISAFLAACGPTAPTPTTGAAATTPAAAATTAPAAAATATAPRPAAAGASPAAAGSPGAARPSGSPAAGASPAAGGTAELGVVTDMPLGRGGGLGPGPSRRGGGGTVKLLWWQAPTILNPHQAQGTKDYDAARLVLEPLASAGPDDKLVPFLAAEIPSRQNGGLAPDGKSVTWKLKQGVKWSDGSELTSADVVFTFKYITDKETASVTQGPYVEAVDRVEAVDTHTARVFFKEPTPNWFSFFTGGDVILQEKQFSQGMGAQAKNFPGNLKPIGTGPYMVQDFAPGDLVTYVINPGYRDANAPFFDGVEMKGGGDAPSAARAVLQTGDYNVAWNLQIEPAILDQLQRGGKGRLELTPNWGVERILVNFSDPNKEVDGQRSHFGTPHPFQTDKKVREAYALLCDRKTIADTLYGAGMQPTANIVTNPKAYDTNAKWEFNIQKAEQLLTEAGYTKQGQYRQKGGVQLSVLFQTTVNAVRQKHQEIVKAAFERAGIKTELKAVPGGVFFSSEAGNPDTAAHFYTDLEMYTTSGGLDPWVHLSGWTTDEIAQKENSWNGNNYMRWSNKEYDDLIRQAKTELDLNKRTQILNRAQDVLINDYAMIAQVDRVGPQAVSNELKGLEVTAWDFTTWNIANWTRG